ncbi:hypothetical protein GQ457_02G021920 [Hibiscus cannabinus]
MASSRSNLFIVALVVWMTRIRAKPKFPAIIIFGDSSVDPGNNNYINTFFKANLTPYGTNFPGHLPTGRTGVSFASAGSGYDDLTTTLSNVITVSRQVEMFGSYIDKLKGIVGDEEAKSIIAKALVLISAGTNDVIFNFFDIPTRRLEFNFDGYTGFLLQRLEDLVEEIYDLGCRKIIVVGLPPIGCLPFQMTLGFENPRNRHCLEDQNSDARSYNKKLVRLLPEIQAELPRSKLVYADAYQPLMDMINHPEQYEELTAGIAETSVGCCGSGILVRLSLICNRMSPVCRNPREYVFWDSVHPTQLVYRQLANYVVKEIVPKLSYAF